MSTPCTDKCRRDYAEHVVSDRQVVLLQAPAENGQGDMDELVPLVSRAQTTSIQRLNRSLWSDTSATNNGESVPTPPSVYLRITRPCTLKQPQPFRMPSRLEKGR